MRKHYKQKSKSCCALCKPHKTGHAVRWKTRELVKRTLFTKKKYKEL